MDGTELLEAGEAVEGAVRIKARRPPRRHILLVDGRQLIGRAGGAGGVAADAG